MPLRLKCSALLCGTVLLLCSCGSRLTSAQILAESSVGGGAGQASSNSVTEHTGGPGIADVAPVGGVSTVATGAPGRGEPQSPGTTVVGSGGPGGSAPESGAKSVVNAAPAGGGVNSCAGQAAGSSIVVGFIGNLSGFGGSTGQPAAEAWTVWAKMVNAEGGINCHPVKVLVADDGGSSQNDVTIAQDFVESQGVIALTVAVTDPTAIAGFAQSHSVPVVGSELGGDAWHETPMFFPTFADSIAGVWGAARLARDDGLSKVGSLYCVESQALCKTSNDQFVQYARAEGLQVVYQGSISLTAPDYTANCLQAQGAGAQLLFIAGDSNTVVRVAQSCGRQSYDPVFDIPTGQDAMAGVPQLAGGISAAQAFPWFLRQGSPAIDEYARALQTYAPNLLTNGYVSQSWGWMSAKVFQVAATSGTEGLAPSAKVTTQDILNGLWSMDRNTIGGLDPGPMARTFIRGKATPTTFCVISAKIENHSWVAPNGMTPACQ